MANKAFLKRWSLRRSDGSFPGPPPTGGCCKNDGTCEILTEEECNALAGSAYKGDDVLCADAGCDPAGACCTGTDCNQYTNAYCTELGGAYHGDAVDCVSPDCPDSNVCITTGSCCYYDTSTGQYGCLACRTEQECTDLSDAGSLCDLVWKEATDCNSANCNDIGRCCYHDSGWDSRCTNITETECTALNGHWDSNEACDDCNLGGESENCPTGRCCVAADDGSFSVCQENITQVTCEVWGDIDGYASEWVDGGNCDGDNPCGFGVCCDGENCVGSIFQSQCTEVGGVFDSSMTECIEGCNQCLIGACCTLENCIGNVNECDCNDDPNYTFYANGNCNSNPCDPLGVCCINGECYTKRLSECIDAGGTHHAGNMCDFGYDCSADPCTNVSGTCCVAWQNSQSDGGGYNDCCLEWEPYLATCNFEEGENCEDCRDRVEGELGCQGCGHDNNGPCSDCESGGGGM